MNTTTMVYGFQGQWLRAQTGDMEVDFGKHRDTKESYYVPCMLGSNGKPVSDY